MSEMKIKIIVGFDADGNEEEREVNIDQAIAFLKNQLEGLEQLKRSKKNLDLAIAEKLLEEAQEAMRKVQKEAPAIPIGNAPWVIGPYNPGDSTFPPTMYPTYPDFWTTCGTISDGTSYSNINNSSDVTNGKSMQDCGETITIN